MQKSGAGRTEIGHHEPRILAHVPGTSTSISTDGGPADLECSTAFEWACLNR